MLSSTLFLNGTVKNKFVRKYMYFRVTVNGFHCKDGMLTFCTELGQFLLCTEQCVGKQAEQDRSAAGEDYTSLQHH